MAHRPAAARRRAPMEAGARGRGEQSHTFQRNGGMPSSGCWHRTGGRDRGRDGRETIGRRRAAAGLSLCSNFAAGTHRGAVEPHERTGPLLIQAHKSDRGARAGRRRHSAAFAPFSVAWPTGDVKAASSRFERRPQVPYKTAFCSFGALPPDRADRIEPWRGPPNTPSTHSTLLVDVNATIVAHHRRRREGHSVLLGNRQSRRRFRRRFPPAELKTNHQRPVRFYLNAIVHEQRPRPSE